MNLEPYVEPDKRRGTFNVRWRDVNGKKCRDTFTYTSSRDAKDRLKIVRDMLTNQSLGRVDLSRSPQDCMNAFLEMVKDEYRPKRVRSLSLSVRRFLDFKDSHGRKVIQTMADITRENILKYKASLMGEKLSQHTIQSYMTSGLRRWLGWCVDHKWLVVMPYDKIGVSSPHKIDRFLTDSEISDFEEAITDEEFRCIFRLGYRSGLRPAERLRITDEHIIWDETLNRGEIYIPPDEVKSIAGARYAELPKDVYDILPRRKGLLFPDWTEKRVNGHFNRAKVKAKIIDRVLTDGSVIAKTLYWTRHSYAKRYLERGGRLKKLQIRMGHESIELTADTYGRLERLGIGDDIVVPPISAGHAAGDQKSAGHRRGKVADFLVIQGNPLKLTEDNLNGDGAISSTVK